MTIDWREMALDAGLLREPGSDRHRLIVWLPVAADGDDRCWERVANDARGEVVLHGGLWTTPASTTRTVRRAKGPLARLLGRFGEGKRGRTFILPSGDPVEQCGERVMDGLLVWPEDPTEDLDEEQIRSRWPEARHRRRLGPRLFLVEGVMTRASSGNGAAAESPPQEVGPRRMAEEALASARRDVDRTREVTALTDLGVIALNEGDPRAAVVLLEEAMTLARGLGDAAREGDIMGNLGMALLYVQPPQRSIELFHHELANARSNGDILAQKVAMEHLGLAVSAAGDPRGALDWFEEALGLARRVGDRQQEADLLWLQAIRLAELNRRDAAIEKGQEAVALFSRLAKPQAGWYGAYLQKYRIGPIEDWNALGTAGVFAGPGADPAASAAAGQAPARTWDNPQGANGPGLLRMAMSATKSMAQFAGSGFRTTPPDIQRRRVQTCAACEHHTGMRCKVCGCFTAAKSRLLHESCPIGKWPG
jgi:tetratricopeptide (TPR) repeat protein